MAGPFSLPSSGIAGVTFDLEEYMAINDLFGGETDAHEVAPRRWKADYTTRHLRDADQRAWRAFKNKQRGGLLTFYAYDPEREYPSNYPSGFGGLTRAGGGAFDGTGTVTALTNYGFTIATLPASFVLKEGDLIGLVQSGYRGLYEISADVTANGSGVATVAVEPEVGSVFTTSATFNLYRPVCIMKLTDYAAPRTVVGGVITFSGIQKLY